MVMSPAFTYRVFGLSTESHGLTTHCNYSSYVHRQFSHGTQKVTDVLYSLGASNVLPNRRLHDIIKLLPLQQQQLTNHYPNVIPSVIRKETY